MQFRNIKLMLIGSLLLMLGASCKKWLDVRPTTQLNRDELFSTENGYRDALSGIYSAMASPSLYGREMTFGTMDVLAGYYLPQSQGTYNYYMFYYLFPYKRNDAGRNTACVAIIDNIWKGSYNVIANLNSMLENIDAHKSVFSGDNYNIIKGEALGLRAFVHLDLLRMYGTSVVVDPTAKSIPFVDTLTGGVVSPLLSVNEACDRIIKELETALSLMDNDPIKTGATPTSTVLATSVGTTTLAAYHNRRYHFNYYAVAGALARAYLWKGDKENALKYARISIDAQATRFPWINPAYLATISSSSSARDRTFTSEHLFALNIPDMENYVPIYLSTAGTDFGLQLYSTTATRNAIYENNSVDLRNQYLFFLSGSTYNFSSKLYQDAIASTWYKYQMPLIRISEMYYIAAECEPTVINGLSWLNKVRVARKLDTLANTAITSSALLQNEIQKEYQKEFISEGQLWFYYKRMNKTTLPYNSSFTNTTRYVFDMPDDEYTYGGR
ncbi:MAG: RagB/SusD family nutrient uptake outer membrane protein [Lacibacter sp.]